MAEEPAIALPRRVLLWCLPVLSAVALGFSIYLLWVGKDAVAGCGNSALLDCEGVLASRWSKWLGLPVTLPAALVYAGLCGTTLWLALARHEDQQQRAASIVFILSLLAGGAALWFVGLQLFALDGFCPYCLVVHACGITLAGLVGLLVWMEQSISFAKVALVSALGVAVLVLGQVAIAPPSIQTKSGEDLVAEGSIELGSGPKKSSESEIPSSSLLKDPLAKKPTLTEILAEPELGGSSGSPESSPEIDKPAIPGSVDISFLDESQSSEPVEPRSEAEATKTDPTQNTVRRINSFAITAPAAENGMIELFGGKVKIVMEDVIVLGSPRAPHVVVELFDYSCAHCRALHWRMEEVRRRYGDQLAVVMLPVPLNAGCNETVKETQEAHANACIYARLAIAVWQKRRSQFPAFHARLMEGTDLPEPGQMRYEAGRLLGPRELEDALLSEDIDNQMKIGIQLYKITKLGVIPKLLLGEAVATGKFDNTDELFELFEKTLGLKPLESP